MTITAKIKLPNFTQEFDKNIKQEIRNMFIKNIPNISLKIKERLKPVFVNSIKSSLEYESIQNGQLKAELGLQDPTAIDVVLNTWAENIEVKYTKNRGLGRINIGMIQEDYSDVLTLPESSYSYASIQGNIVIEWLRWLLLEGSSIIVSNYEFEVGDKGRTGLGIMTERVGSGWSVPPQFAGTANDNFATRSLAEIDKSIDDIVRQEITKGL